MKNKRIFLIIPVCALFVGSILFAKAQNIFDIQFPITDLGNCASMQECKVYCDDKNNAQVCASWAESRGFKKPAPPSQQKAGQAPIRKQAISVLAQTLGPGGCKTGEECNAYCSQAEHAQECFTFAKEHNLISQEETIRIESKIQPKEGPGGCKSFEECDAFCRNPDNTKTCIEFSVQEGKITQEDAEFLIQRAQERKGPSQGQPPRGPRPPEPRKPEGPKIDEIKAKLLLEETGGPGGCNSMEVCEQFCSTSGNEETCMNFAVEHGLMPQEEVEKFKKVMSATGPGGCRGRACEQYCENPEHGEECLSFAVENGFINKDEAEEAKKFMEIAKAGGPGGCRGQRECDAFCSKPENREECFNFAKNNNLIPPEEIQKIEKEKEIFTKLESAGGPGGCRGPRECFEYCSNPQHTQECFEFGSKQGLIPQENIQRIEELRKNIPQGQEGFMMMPPPMQGFEGQQGFGMPQQGMMPIPPRGMPFEDQDTSRPMPMGGFGTSSEFQGYPKPPIGQFILPTEMQAPQPMPFPKEGDYQRDFQQQYPMPMPPEFQREGMDFQGAPPTGIYPPPPSQYPNQQYPMMPPSEGGYMMPYQGEGAVPMVAPENSFAPMPAPEPYQQPQSKRSNFFLANPIMMLMNLLK